MTTPSVNEILPPNATHGNATPRLMPGEYVDHAKGHVGRSQPDGAWYYAHRGPHGVPAVLSPTFGTYADALAWLERAA